MVVALGGAMGAASVAEAAPVVTAGAGGVRIDWTRGAIVARAVAPADRRAPSPAVARSGARRAAEDRARAQLRAAAKALPWAGGGTVGDKLGGEAEADIERALRRARVVTEEYGTDGSVKVEMALAVEALRVAVDGARKAAAGPGVEDAGEAATAVVVDARGLKVAPVAGLRLEPGDARGPVVFATARPGVDVIGKRPLEVKAARLRGATVVVAGEKAGEVAKAVEAGAVIVVMVKGRKD